MSLNILNSNKKSSSKAKILPQFSISSENKPLLDLLEIQRKSFFDFLQHGIPHELAKIAVFRETAKNSACKQELELKFNPETYKFISPNFTPKEAILNGKTYACKVYVQATLMIRSPYDIQKTDLFSVVADPSNAALVPQKGNPSMRWKEKVKQKSNFHLSFNDKNKRVNASKLLHNTYTKWLQSPFVYQSSSLTLSSPISRAYPSGIPEGVTLLTSNQRKGLETEKQRKGVYSLPSATGLLTQLFRNSFASQAHTNLRFSMRLGGKRVKTDTSQLLQISDAALPFVRSDAYPLRELVQSKEGGKLRQSITVQLHKPTYGVWGISSWVRAQRGSRSVKSWGFAELHLRFAKAHLRQCWLPLSKTLLSKKLHIGLFANRVTPSGTPEGYAYPFGVKELLKNKESNILEKQLVALHETAKLKSLYLTKQEQLKLLSDAYSSGVPKGVVQSKKGVTLPVVTSSRRIPAVPLWDTAVPLNKTWGTATVNEASPIPIQISDLSGVKELRKKTDYLSTPTDCFAQEATQNIQIFRPWIFLGELPLMTKRGHFILNGSPRVIVNQIARCPGIYFQEKRRGVGIEQEIRVSADLIPQRGPWLRIQSDWEGRFWARLKQEGRVKYATLYEAFQEFEKEYNPPLICLLSNSYFTNTTSSLFSKSENVTFQERKIKEDRQKKALIRLFKNSSRYSLGKLGRSRVNERIHSSFTRCSHSATQVEGGLRSWQGKEELAQLRSLLAVSDKSKIRRVPALPLQGSPNTATICNSWQSKSNNKISVASDIYSCNSAKIPSKRNDKLMQPTHFVPYKSSICKGLKSNCVNEVLNPEGVSSPNDEVNGLSISNYANSINYTTNSLINRKNILQILGSKTGSGAHTLRPIQISDLSGVKAYADAPLSLKSVNKELHYFFNEGYSLQNYDLLFQQHKVLLEEELRSNGDNELLRNSSSGLKSNCVNELMAKDLDAIHTCLERLLEGQGFTDDIDNLKNRFIRTSGKLLQQQFELGLFRLNEVIMPLLGNLLPDYPRVNKSKYSTNKNIKRNNSALQDTNLVDKLKPAYGVKSTRVLSTSNNYNKDDTPHTLTPLRSTKSKFSAACGEYIINSKRNPKGIVSTQWNPLRRIPLWGTAVPPRNPLQIEDLYGTKCVGSATTATICKKSQRIPLTLVGAQRVGGIATVCNSWQGKKGFLPLLRCANQKLRGQKLFTSSLLRVLAERRRGKYENFSYLRETEIKKPVADGYSKEVSLIKNAPFRWLRTSKPINSAFREFFGSNPLSQYMDQTNPLAEITHKRRLSSMGPGGIKRETAGMEVRGIHPTHYGRVCPIETPEGKNAGLVNSPTVYGRVGNYGFLETPLYQVIENQVQTKRWTFFSAQYEERQNSSLATCDTGLLQFNFLAHVPIPVQTANNPLTHFQQVERHRVGYRALSPIQTISIATALIPFLEHDDANRALMGSNMQRQAIPLLSPERPIVGTGFEPLVVMESGQALQATKLGCVSQADANSIIIHTRYSIEKPLLQNILQNSNLPWSRTLVHRFDIRIPFTPVGAQRVGLLAQLTPKGYPYKSSYKSTICTCKGLQRGIAGIRSGWPKDGVITPHLYKWQLSYCAKQSPEGVTLSYGAKQSPLQIEDLYGTKCVGSATVRSKAFRGTAEPWRKHACGAQSSMNKKHISYSHNTFLLRPLKQDLQFYERSNQETCLNQRPLVQEGDWIQKGDFLADSSASRSGDLALGKNVTVAYMPWEGYNFEDAIVISDRLVSDDIYTSLHIERYEIKVSKNSQGKERITNRVPGSSHSLKHLDNFGIARVSSWVQPGDILVGKVVELKRPLSPYERLAWELASRLSPKSPEREKWLNKVWLEDISLRLPPGVCGRVINSQIISTEYAYPAGVTMSDPSLLSISQGGKYKEQTIYPQEVHVYLAVKRKIQIGDKLAGRHGNKGIVSAILPQEDMPYLGNGSCIDMVLNPLGVPSRMNLGQIFECLLGLAGSQLGCNFRITPFDEIAGGEASRSLVFLKLYQCRLMYKQQWLFTPTFPGKSKLFDGRTGEPFENWVTVGQAYMLKLIHMVDHKIHARSTGPYSLFTRQPVRGRSRRGGQRLGEMEVWAVEGFGAAYTLQEFLTIKSDDLKARTALQKGFYKQNDVTFGKIHIAPGNPEAFKVLVSELQALCLHIQM